MPKSERMAPLMQKCCSTNAFDEYTSVANKGGSAVSFNDIRLEDDRIKIEVRRVVRTHTPGIGISRSKDARIVKHFDIPTIGCIPRIRLGQYKRRGKGEGGLKLAVRPGGKSIHDRLQLGLHGGICGWLSGLVGKAHADGEEFLISLRISRWDNRACPTGTSAAAGCHYDLAVRRHEPLAKMSASAQPHDFPARIDCRLVAFGLRRIA